MLKLFFILFVFHTSASTRARLQHRLKSRSEKSLEIEMDGVALEIYQPAKIESHIHEELRVPVKARIEPSKEHPLELRIIIRYDECFNIDKKTLKDKLIIMQHLWLEKQVSNTDHARYLLVPKLIDKYTWINHIIFYHVGCKTTLEIVKKIWQQTMQWCVKKTYCWEIPSKRGKNDIVFMIGMLVHDSMLSVVKFWTDRFNVLFANRVYHQFKAVMAAILKIQRAFRFKKHAFRCVVERLARMSAARKIQRAFQVNVSMMRVVRVVREKERQRLCGALLQLGECPVCFEQIMGNVWMCLDSHVMCEMCKEEVMKGDKKCPECRMDLLETKMVRNRQMEKIRDLLNVGTAFRRNFSSS